MTAATKSLTTAILFLSRSSLSFTQGRKYYSTTSKLFAMSASSETTKALSPPIARREEDRVVYAGVAPEGWDSKMVCSVVVIYDVIIYIAMNMCFVSNYILLPPLSLCNTLMISMIHISSPDNRMILKRSY